MMCEKCSSWQSKVIDSRPYRQVIRRRRLCLDCNNRWTTMEITTTALNEIPGGIPVETLKQSLWDMLCELEKATLGVKRLHSPDGRFIKDGALTLMDSL